MAMRVKGREYKVDWKIMAMLGIQVVAVVVALFLGQREARLYK